VSDPASSPTSLRDLPAPAKINLFLHVVGRRDDGMHLLQSLFVLIDWCDTLHLERRDDGAVTRQDLTRALPADDLTVRAARALQAASGTRFGVDIAIDKQVPWGAGLGGGSSDAATTLIALNRLWGLGWTRARLAELAARLGADVPFFIGGRTAFVEGIGERLTPHALPPLRLAVIKPAAALATADVFRHPAVMRNSPARTLADILAGFPADAFSPSSMRELPGRNDLETAAFLLSDEVAQASTVLRDRYGHARMSGSGSAVFAVVDGKDDASGAAELAWASTIPSGWSARMCRSLDRHPLDGWLV
jgi:4-diphosphocytidyl-2-C-methyl-D-erythritol kinase